MDYVGHGPPSKEFIFSPAEQFVFQVLKEIEMSTGARNRPLPASRGDFEKEKVTVSSGTCAMNKREEQVGASTPGSQIQSATAKV